MLILYESWCYYMLPTCMAVRFCSWAYLAQLTYAIQLPALPRPSTKWLNLPSLKIYKRYRIIKYNETIQHPFIENLRDNVIRI